ncbi:uncharacterized protein LOC121976986 [Zingiber officinale]|uniref:Uncharacterized protein n=1 Tax=Zingiber officinale TaxID=94328 RepID=A0A8J5LIB4_ZINOF|nr:uncharacterized protein LOC121976986 [Zingiber officinale]KAG6512803.1 hypothetical protein ZIOFF_030932 [Zingiber officinale]
MIASFSFSALPPIPCHGSATLSFKPTSLRFLIKRRPKGGAGSRRAIPFVRAAGGGANGMKQDDEDNVTENDSKNGGGDLKRERQRTGAFNLRWRDLLSPDPDNALAVALTGLLTWASVQVVFQLFFISVAILLAALKYSFIAALLLFILIALL